jgi:hypothetical protein
VREIDRGEINENECQGLLSCFNEFKYEKDVTHL